MKRWRVVLTCTFLLGVAFFLLLVPVPLSRIRGSALVEAHPDAIEPIRIRHEGTLERLFVKEGDKVREGDVLAQLSSLELEAQLTQAQTQVENSRKLLDYLTRQKDVTADLKLRGEIDLEVTQARSGLNRALAAVDAMEKIKREDLVIRAPRDGVATGVPMADALGRQYKFDEPFCVIIEPGRIRVCLPVQPDEWQRLKENVEPISLAAAQTHATLHQYVNVSFEEIPLKKALEKITESVDGLHMVVDPRGGIPESLLNEPVTLKVNRQRIRQVLHRLFEPRGLGYVVVSTPGEAQDGWIVIRSGQERGHSIQSDSKADLPVVVRIQGRDEHLWKGKLLPLPQSEATDIPMELSDRAAGPVPVKPGGNPEILVPQTQQYLVYVDVIDPDTAIVPGQMAQVKISCKPETCVHWLWRTVNQMFDLGLW